MGLSGLEPPTSRLSGARSNQLSYKPPDSVRFQTRILFSLAVELSPGTFICLSLSSNSDWRWWDSPSSLSNSPPDFLNSLREPFLFESLDFIEGPKGPSLHSNLSVLQWRWWDSNPWPPACRAGALPTELHPHLVCCGSFLWFQWTLSLIQNWTTNSSYFRPYQ